MVVPQISILFYLIILFHHPKTARFAAAGLILTPFSPFQLFPVLIGPDLFLILLAYYVNSQEKSHLPPRDRVTSHIKNSLLSSTLI